MALAVSVVGLVSDVKEGEMEYCYNHVAGAYCAPHCFARHNLDRDRSSIDSR